MADPLSALRAVSGNVADEVTSGMPPIPAVPATNDAGVANWMASVKSWLEKASSDGAGFVTKRYLTTVGVLQSNGAGGYNAPLLPDMTIPPAPTGLIASGAMTTILVEWDNPAYRNHGRTEIWAAGSNNLSMASLVGTSNGVLFAHSVPPGSTRYYWARFVSSSGIVGPYNGVDGVMGQTAQDPEYLLGLLTGRITKSQLYADLSSRIDAIDLIDGPSSMHGSLNAHVAALSVSISASATEIRNEVDSRVQGLQTQINEFLAIPTYDAATAYSTGDIVVYNGNVYRAKSATTGNVPTNSTYWDLIGEYTSIGEAVAAHTAQISSLLSAVSAEVTARELLATSVAANTAAITTEQTARANADSAMATQITSLLASTSSNAAAITNEQTVRANAVSALSSQLTALDAVVGTNAASIVSEQTARVAADSVLSSQIQSVSAALVSGLAENVAAITAEQTARVSAVEALAEDISALEVGLSNGLASSVAAINAEQSARVTADEAFATQLTSVQASITSGAATSAAAITAEQTARIAADNAFATQLTNLQAQVTNGDSINDAAIKAEQTARATADAANASSIATVQAVANAKNKTYYQTTAPSGATTGDLWFDLDDTNKSYRYNGSSWVLTSDTRISANAAAITAEQTARANADSALASQINSLQVEIESGLSTNAAAIVTEQAARANADSAISNQIATLDARLNTDVAYAIAQAQTTANAAVVSAGNAQNLAASKNKTFFQPSVPSGSSGDLWIDTDDSNKIYRYDGGTWIIASDLRIESTVSQLNTLQASVTNGLAVNYAAIVTETNARVSADQALTNQITTLQSTSNGLMTSVQTHAEAISNLGGKYTVKVDNNGYVAGYGLAVDANNGTPTSAFLILASEFAIAPVASDPNAADGAPFYHLTVPTVIEGVTVPAGTYMKAAFIADGTISRAKIGNLAVDDAKIANLSATKIRSGEILVGEHIGGSYVPGYSGWRINGDGTAEFNNATLRGSLYANSGYFSGIVSAASVQAALSNSTNYEYSTPGTHYLTIPTGLDADSIRVRIIGAGGGGGAAGGAGASYADAPGGVGGTGASGVITDYTVSYSAYSGSTLTITIGQGGSGGSNANSQPGWNISFYGGYGGPGSAGTSSSVSGIGSAAGGAAGGGGTGGRAYTAWVNEKIVTLYEAGTAGTPSYSGGGAGGVSDPSTGWGTAGGNGANGYVLISIYKGDVLVKNTSYQNLLNWLDGIGHGTVPSNAR